MNQVRFLTGGLIKYFECKPPCISRWHLEHTKIHLSSSDLALLKEVIPEHDFQDRKRFSEKISAFIEILKWGETERESILLADRNAWKSRVAKLKADRR